MKYIVNWIAIFVGCLIGNMVVYFLERRKRWKLPIGGLRRGVAKHDPQGVSILGALNRGTLVTNDPPPNEQLKEMKSVFR